jgi:AcrR family transcriptional regulator
MSRDARQHILDVAAQRFYAEGFRAVGVDTLVEASGVAKMTLYRHFPSKDHLILAYLQRANEQYWHWFERAIEGVGDARAQLTALFESTAQLVTSPQCLGCTFQVAAAEFPDPQHPAHALSLEHKNAVRQRLCELARAAGAAQPELLGDHLALLLDGVWAAVRMYGTENHGRHAASAAKTLIDAALK